MSVLRRYHVGAPIRTREIMNGCVLIGHPTPGRVNEEPKDRTRKAVSVCSSRARLQPSVTMIPAGQSFADGQSVGQADVILCQYRLGLGI